jgi:hypothetical protein
MSRRRAVLVRAVLQRRIGSRSPRSSPSTGRLQQSDPSRHRRAAAQGTFLKAGPDESPRRDY